MTEHSADKDALLVVPVLARALKEAADFEAQLRKVQAVIDAATCPADPAKRPCSGGGYYCCTVIASAVDQGDE